MLKNRLTYLSILVSTTSFFICFNGYYSLYVFALSLALPFFSLLISLPGMLTVRAEVAVGQEEPFGDARHPRDARCGKAVPLPLYLKVSSRWILPAGRAKVRLLIENRFTGETRREDLEFSPAHETQVLEHKLQSDTCGYLVCRLTKARAYDLLGLFCLPVRLGKKGRRLSRGEECRLIVHPNAFESVLGLGPRRAPDGEGERYSQVKPGSDPTELFGLRDYRPGDRLNRVDWKLSQKTGGLLVREASLPLAQRVFILVDLYGDGAEADLLMDALMTISQSLCRQEVGHVIAFSQKKTLRFLSVDQPQESVPAVEAVLCGGERSELPIDPPAGAPMDIARVVYLCPQPAPGGLGMIGDLYPRARLTVLHIRPLGEEGQTVLPEEAALVRIRQGCVGADLDGLFL